MKEYYDENKKPKDFRKRKIGIDGQNPEEKRRKREYENLCNL